MGGRAQRYCVSLRIAASIRYYIGDTLWGVHAHRVIYHSGSDNRQDATGRKRFHENAFILTAETSYKGYYVNHKIPNYFNIFIYNYL